MMSNNGFRRGDVFLANLGSGEGSEQGGLRPVVIIQNNIGNTYSPTVIVAAITSKLSKKQISTHVQLSQEQYKTPKTCVILTEQVKTIDKKRLIGDKLFSLNDMDSIRLDRAIKVSFGLEPVRCSRNNSIAI